MKSSEEVSLYLRQNSCYMHKKAAALFSCARRVICSILTTDSRSLLQEARGTIQKTLHASTKTLHASTKHQLPNTKANPPNTSREAPPGFLVPPVIPLLALISLMGLATCNVGRRMHSVSRQGQEVAEAVLGVLADALRVHADAL